jgi:hypothetical protein
MPRRKIMTKKAPRKRYGKRRVGKRRAPGARLQTIKVRAPNVVCPDRTMVKLSYLDVSNQSVGSLASNVGGVVYTPTDGHTLNPIGWSEMSSLYRFYRVRAASWSITCVNQEAFPVTVFTCPINITYSVTLPHGQQLFMNTLTKSKVLASKGGADKATLKSYVTTRKMVGSKTATYDDNYAALTTSTPANNWYLYLYAMSTEGSNTFTVNNQVQFTARLMLYVEFYERNILSS